MQDVCSVKHKPKYSSKKEIKEMMDRKWKAVRNVLKFVEGMEALPLVIHRNIEDRGCDCIQHRIFLALQPTAMAEDPPDPPSELRKSESTTIR